VETVIDVVGFGVPILFMCIGIVSLLPLSEYRYAKQGGVNPAIAREIVQHTRRKPERKEFGILMGIAGLAIVFRFDPWLALFFLVSPYIGVPITTILITIILLISIALRNRKLETIRK
jgi:phage shock protein PspC (stress-responsive transcriptional regulator)